MARVPTNGTTPVAGLEAVDANAGMRMFDQQPLWLKRMLWASPLNLTCDSVTTEAERAGAAAELARLEKCSALEHWGPEHPAAQTAAPTHLPVDVIGCEAQRLYVAGTLRLCSPRERRQLRLRRR